VDIRKLITNIFKPQKRLDSASELALMTAGFAGGSHQYLTAIPAPNLALRNSVVNFCVSLIATTISTLPLKLIDTTTKKEAVNHPISKVLDRPNDEQTIVEFLEMFLVNFLLWGNGLAEKEITRGRITGLWPMCAPRVTPLRSDGELFYEYYALGQSQGLISADNVIHLRWPGFDDISGTSPVWCAEQAIRLAMTQEKMLLENFGDGVRPDYIIHLPPEKALERLQTLRQGELEKEKHLLQSQIEGAKTRRGLYVPFGYEVSSYQANYQQAQVTEIRDSQVLDIARFWRVPTSKLNVLSKTSNGAQTEAERIAYFQDTIGPIVVKLEKRLERDLLSDNDRLRYQIKFNTKGLLRADTQQQTLQYVQYLQTGIYTRNEIRAFEDMPPYNDQVSDKPFSPTNLTTDNVPGANQPTNPNQGALQPPAMDTNPTRLLTPITETQTRASTRIQKPLSEPQKRSLANRKTVGAAVQPLFSEAVARCIRKEKSAVMKDAKSIMGKRSKENLADRLKSLYSGELQSFIGDQLTKPVDILFNQLQPLMEAELDTNFADDQIAKIKKDYTRIWVRDYVHSSLHQLLDVMDSAEGDDAIVSDLEERFDQWENGRTDESPSRADKVSAQESRKGINVFARAVYGLAGVSSLIWVVSSPCEICEPFDGLVFSVNSDITSPPIHNGCECDITDNS